MSSAGSVTLWIGRLRAGDPRAAQELWERYFRRLVGLARQMLKGTPQGAADGEDAVVNCFDSFFRGAKEGRFPQLHDRDDLWQLLIAITAHKVIDQVRREGRQKRGGGAVLDEAALVGQVSDGMQAEGLEQILGREPSPEFAAQVAEEYQRLLDLLDDDELRWIALRKMEGYRNEEMAAQLGCAPRSITRKLRRIRTLWSQQPPQ